jgi:exodeoxyribonuclease V alpha subunit
MDSLTLTVRIEAVTFSNPEGSFAVCRATNQGDGQMVTLVGPLFHPFKGQVLEVTGSLQDHRKYGTQIRVTRVFAPEPTTLAGIKAFLQSGQVPGIGPKLAESLVSHFGDDLSQVLEEAPARIAEAPGIGKKKAATIAKQWVAQREQRALISFLVEHQLPPTLAARLHKTWGGTALARLRANPYNAALEVRGVGFLTADRLARALGLEKGNPQRVQAGLVYEMECASLEGHTCLPRSTLLDRATKRLGVDHSLCDGALAAMTARRDHLVEERGTVWLPYLYRAETMVSERLSGLLRAQPRLGGIAQPRDLQGLSREQRLAVQRALDHPVSIVTGGPGTGKSTLTRALCSLLERRGVTPLLLAPTGKAAKRLAEVTGRPAQTIHRALGLQPGSGFVFNKDNPLDKRVIIVDEVSMVDAPLMAHLVAACNPAQPPHLMLLGDADQLPSVGPGSILRDLLASGAVPVTCLTEIFRQGRGSLIAHNARRILAGQMPQEDETGQGDYYQVVAPSAAAAQQAVIETVRNYLNAGYSWEEIGLLTPMRRGQGGCEGLNAALQETFNPARPGAALVTATRRYRVDDRVIQMRNDYGRELFNGDTGRVIAVNVEGPALIVRFDDGREVECRGLEEIGQLELAYALTIHKSQGSEWPVTIVVVLTQHYTLLERSLLYTAVTRAREQLALVGDPRAVQMAVRRATDAKRSTALPRLLAG